MSSQKSCIQMFMVALFKTWKQPICLSTDEQINYCTSRSQSITLLKRNEASSSGKTWRTLLIHITWWKKPVYKNYILYDSNYMTFWKRQNYGDCFCFVLFFKLYITVLVLPNIKMNPPQVYMCSPSWILLPPPSPFQTGCGGCQWLGDRRLNMQETQKVFKAVKQFLGIL